MMKEKRKRENTLTCLYKYTFSDKSPNNPTDTRYYYPHFVEEENRTQQGQIACPHLPIAEVLNKDLNLTIKLSSTRHHKVSQSSNYCAGNFYLQLT